MSPHLLVSKVGAHPALLPSIAEQRGERPEAKVVVVLLGQLLDGQGVEGVDLLRQDLLGGGKKAGWGQECLASHHPFPWPPVSSKYLAVVEAFAKQDDFGNEGGVRHHHGDGAEHGLEVVGQLRASGVTCQVAQQSASVPANVQG